MLLLQKESHNVVKDRPSGTLPFWENVEILITDPVRKSLVLKDGQCFF